MAEPTADRLTRLLALIAYLRENQNVPVTEVADHFGITPAQVLSDINLLWVTGTPGYLPDDLIDFSADALDRDVITLTDARGMDRPLRLSTDEALSLLVALRALDALVADDGVLGAGPQALASAAAKLQDAAGAAAARAEAVQVDLRSTAAPGALTAVRHALAESCRVHLRYVSAADEVTARDVDPLELSSDGSMWFLRGWCHRTAGERTFRLDRVLAVDVLDDPATRVGTDRREPVPELGPDLPLVRLELTSRARWVAEHVPVEQVSTRQDGSILVEVRVADPAWLTNLVLSLGEAVLSVDPPALAAPVAARARAALDAYEELS
ncbi:WYL domain-containing protein [Georgenia sp. 10Sc9-8]|uniref:WYL domain-containing protein n=1 Tax=Georgenia halotolerans TaxID=3028317 RepID=A0ABT5TZ65_9MICO|nr:WYL domain-containing protein [Georgenia halotolerans]